MRLLSASFAAEILIAAVLSPGAASAQAKQPGGFFAQRFTFSAGTVYSLHENSVPASAGMLAAPRLFITTAYTDFSVSFDPSPQLLHSFSDSDNISDKIFFQLPLMLRVNLGHLASKDFRSTYGFFAGAGWNLQLGQGKSTNSFCADAGVRFWLFGQSFTAMYQRLFTEEKIFSSPNFFSLQINLGKYLSQVKANNKVSNFMKPYRKKK